MTDAQTLRNLRHRIAPLGDLTDRITLKIGAVIDFAHPGLLAPNLGKKASMNLGAFQSSFALHFVSCLRREMQNIVKMDSKTLLKSDRR
ncbi:hypothetical protein, partial [Rhodoblastus sp.]|uniref:hypothetical protein n=1 Tax=Rhodoblastus sp. TaxID=1962975 RepID=UPI0026154230